MVVAGQSFQGCLAKGADVYGITGDIYYQDMLSDGLPVLDPGHYICRSAFRKNRCTYQWKGLLIFLPSCGIDPFHHNLVSWVKMKKLNDTEIVGDSSTTSKEDRDNKGQQTKAAAGIQTSHSLVLRCSAWELTFMWICWLI